MCWGLSWEHQSEYIESGVVFNLLEYVFNVYESNFENFNKICEENNINCIKLLDYNINYNEIYIDEDGHFNENGSCIAAINLSNYLVQKKIRTHRVKNFGQGGYSSVQS